MILPAVHTFLYHTHIHVQGCTCAHIRYAHRVALVLYPQVSLSFEPTISTRFNTRQLINYAHCCIITILPEGLYSESLLILMTGFNLCCMNCVTGGERPSRITWGCGKCLKYTKGYKNYFLKNYRLLCR